MKISKIVDFSKATTSQNPVRYIKTDSTCPLFSIGVTCDYGVAGGRVEPEKSKIFDYVIFGRSLSLPNKKSFSGEE